MTKKSIDFCCEEVARQYANNLREGYFAVPGMLKAWRDACTCRTDQNILRHHDHLTESNILVWAGMIESCNKDGYRKVGVRVGSSIKCKPEEVPDRMKRFIEQFPNMTPEEAYLNFEEIHPFRDGNGRVGKIIFFYLRNEMDKPSHEVVPNPWGITNP